MVAFGADILAWIALAVACFAAPNVDQMLQISGGSLVMAEFFKSFVVQSWITSDGPDTRREIAASIISVAALFCDLFALISACMSPLGFLSGLVISSTGWFFQITSVLLFLRIYDYFFAHTLEIPVEHDSFVGLAP
jgi:hypothetical protein